MSVKQGRSTPTQALAVALDRFDFEEADAILATLGYGKNDACRELALVGMEIRQLDAEEFARRAKAGTPLPGTVREALRNAGWPSAIADQHTGALADLRPTYQLLLELAAINYHQRNWTDVLALIHLMSEYLPLLAWQPVLGHAGVPRELAVRFDTAGATSPRPSRHDGCALGKPSSDLADRLTSPPRDNQELRHYLRGTHSRVAALLLTCGGAGEGAVAGSSDACHHQCSVVTGRGGDISSEERAALARRATVARRFAASPIVALRHASPVGHFFSVPGRHEIDEAWRKTRRSIARALNEMRASPQEQSLLSRELIPGLEGVVGYCAGSDVPMQPSHVLADLRSAIASAI